MDGVTLIEENRKNMGGLLKKRNSDWYTFLPHKSWKYISHIPILAEN